MVLNSCGIDVIENISLFSWSLMGMAVTEDQVSNFDVQSGSCHLVKNIDVISTAHEFGEAVINYLGSLNIDSFNGELLLSPSASTELVQDVVGHSINSNNVQKQANKFKDIDNPVSTDLLSLEDDATNVGAIGASSFDREGVAHQKNAIIQKGISKGFIYNTYTANKDGIKSIGNAGGSPNYRPSVSTTILVRAGNSKLETLISEIRKGIILNLFSGSRSCRWRFLRCCERGLLR
jgi:PmbA protein